MANPSSLVVFHVQAGSRIGMGHLSRSRAIIGMLQVMGFNCTLYLDSDAQGAAKARALGLEPIDALPAAPSALVIDAITLDRMQADVLQSYAPRILISPVFNRVDIISHALVRSAPFGLLDNLPDGATLHIKTDYAFATAHGLHLRKLDFSKLEIGLCLSGGVDSMEPNTVLSVLDALPQVAGVKVIDPRSLPPVKTDLHHVLHADRPWDLLQGINVFVGGDGVMLAEAIAQGLPTISLSTPSGNAKNIGLVKSGALRIIERHIYMQYALSTLLDDREELEAMHSAALKLNGAARSTRLAEDIRTILEEKSQ
ncbi:hypothetical protein [Cyanobium sp. FACHB-13342]|uniref:hypothetical protein n=1 Tax=Cyanobium sp. FACHB-13342 TaxID=2692793 RepID=UPI001680677E|nr:hypothetical protein [Cyanobium sp. FACHB-13342]MBD2422484.1 hypothetical protein [Cyanobium sp. FACHB-13342]